MSKTNETKTVAGHTVPVGISKELEAGLVAYQSRVDAIGYGARIRATMPNGDVQEGELIELGSGGGQAGLRRDDGKRYRILNLDTIEVV